MYGKEGDRRDVEADRPLGFANRLVDAEPVDARHRSDRNALFLAVDQEERPDEVGGRQDVFRNQPPRPFRLAVAARALRQVETAAVAMREGLFMRAAAPWRGLYTVFGSVAMSLLHLLEV